MTPLEGDSVLNLSGFRQCLQTQNPPEFIDYSDNNGHVLSTSVLPSTFLLLSWFLLSLYISAFLFLHF